MEQVANARKDALFDVAELAWMRVLAGAVLGWLIWYFSVAMTGEVEPWDSPHVYYSFTLVLAGASSTLFQRTGWYWGPVGVFAGQVAYIFLVYQPQNPIFPTSVAIILFGTWQPLLGGAIGVLMGRQATGWRKQLG